MKKGSERGLFLMPIGWKICILMGERRCGKLHLGREIFQCRAHCF